MTKTEVLALISEKIKANGKGEITAEVLAEVLNGVVGMMPENALTIEVSPFLNRALLPSEEALVDSSPILTLDGIAYCRVTSFTTEAREFFCQAFNAMDVNRMWGEYYTNQGVVDGTSLLAIYLDEDGVSHLGYLEI